MSDSHEPTRWWWVRHGPVHGPLGRIYGQSDVPCDFSDTDSFNTLAAILPTDAVWIVTPLQRTRMTAEAIAAAKGVVLTPVVEPDLAEQNFGRWQGLNWSEMQERDPQTYAAFWRDPTRNSPPGGESYATQMERTRTAIERLNARYAGRDIVCVSHGGTIRAAVAMALDLSPETAMAVVVDNLSITRLNHVQDGLLRGKGGVWMVQGINAPCRWIP
ncbi:MAG: histidine phosphatase family protein [Rhodospirillales bacterium]|nr:histidine phosphatase family protein [Rhodospirillales bacterium]